MYGPRHTIDQYRQTRQATGDNPHRVIALLLGGALERIHRAEAALGRGDRPAKIAAIQSALEILDGLRLSLDHEAGGEIARGLETLYEYVSFRLIEANAGDDAGLLQEAARLLAEIDSAWAAIAGEVAAAPGGGHE